MYRRTIGVNRARPQLVTLKEKGQYKVIKIRTHNKQSIWSLFKKFINSLDDNTEFGRIDLMCAIYEKESAKAMISRETTVDHYRLYSCHIGFVDHIGNGKYRKMHNIPENMTSTFLKKYAYNDATWKDWFIPETEKLLRACNACK